MATIQTHLEGVIERTGCNIRIAAKQSIVKLKKVQDSATARLTKRKHYVCMYPSA